MCILRLVLRIFYAYAHAHAHPAPSVYPSILLTPAHAHTCPGLAHVPAGSPYQNIQARIMVGTYHIVRKMPGGDKLVAMTRILHRTTPDEVMDEVRRTMSGSVCAMPAAKHPTPLL